MNVVARLWAVGVLGAAVIGGVVVGGSAVANAGIASTAASGAAAQFNLHQPGNGDSEIATGPGVVVAKPNGGGTSKPDAKRCKQLLASANEDLQNLGWANAYGDRGAIAIARDMANNSIAAGQAAGCSWAS